MAEFDEHADTETLELDRSGRILHRGQATAVAIPAETTGEGSVVPSAMRDCGVIGRGGMGVVHQVYEPALDRMVATKVLRPERMATDLADFLQEARVLARLEHPGIVPLHQLGRDDMGRIDRFSMKLVHGQSLGERLAAREGRALDPDELAACLRQMLQVCDALSFAHSRGVIHRDLKPENVMLGRFGEVYVMDWGIAIDRTLPGRVAGKLLGTPAYMAPEQFLAGEDRIDERTDVFGLGAILYEVLTGGPPHRGETIEETLAQARRCKPAPPEQLKPDADTPAALSDIVMRALSEMPEERYQSVAELKDALQRFVESGAWAHRRRFSSGAVIVSQGEPGDTAYLVERGRCGVYSDDSGGRNLLRELGPGDAFGEISLFTGQPRSATVVALSDVTLLRISRVTFERSAPSGSWLRSFVGSLAERFLEHDRTLRQGS